MLVLALMLDGRIGRQDWAFIQRAAGSVRPPLEAKWSETVHLTNTSLGDTDGKDVVDRYGSLDVAMCFDESRDDTRELTGTADV